MAKKIVLSPNKPLDAAFRRENERQKRARRRRQPPKGGKFLGPRPDPARPLNADQIAGSANAASAEQINAMMGALPGVFNQLQNNQLNSIDRIAAGLNNQYTADARNQINRSFGAADQMGNLANQTVGIGDAAGARINALAPQAVNIGDRFMGQLGGLGSMLGDQARQGFATAGPTEIEAELYRQGQQELALGRSLSPEQMREATQSARQGMAARGMATGNAALGAELLNRDRFATQRQAERRAFAGTANNLREQNVMARREAAANMATAGGNLFDAAGRMGMAGRELAGNLYQTGATTQMSGRQIGGALLGDAGRLRQTGSAMMAELDPYQRALNPGLSLGQTASQLGLGATGDSFGRMGELYGNAASFNANMANNRYINWMDAAAGIVGANQQAQATRDASRRTAGDYIIGGLQALGLSDRREKKDIKPLGNAGSVLGLPAYKFRYKGEDKEHVGFMAQDVQKVLPEAVAEVDYKGKKRLAIRPMVIGAALANELMTAKAA